jgi:hypothetical protein
LQTVKNRRLRGITRRAFFNNVGEIRRIEQSAFLLWDKSRQIPSLVGIKTCASKAESSEEYFASGILLAITPSGNNDSPSPKAGSQSWTPPAPAEPVIMPAVNGMRALGAAASPACSVLAA